MGIVSNQSIKNSVSFYLGMLLGAINTVLIYPNVFNNHPEHWGLIQLLVAYSIIISTFSCFGAPKLFIRFFPILKEKGKLFFLSLLFIFIGFVVSLIIIMFLKEEIFYIINANNLLQEYFFYIYILVLIISSYELLVSVSRSYLDSFIPTLLNEVFLKGYTLVILLLHGLEYISFEYFLIFYISGYVLKLIILFIIQHVKNRILIELSFKNINIKELAEYGIYVIIGGASAILVSRLDMVMIGKFLGLKEVAFYTIAFYIGNAIRVPARAVLAISSPLLAKAWKLNNMKQIQTIYSKSSINQFIIGGVFFLCVWLNIDDIFSLLPDKFADGKLVVLFIGLAQLFNVTSGVNGAIILNSKYYRFDLFSNLFLVVLTVFTNYLFIPENSPLAEFNIVGINGAAFATSLSILLFNLIKMIFVKIKIGMHPFSLKTLNTLILLIVLFCIIQIIPVSNNIFIDIPFRAFLVILLFFPIMLKLRLSEDIQKITNDILRKIRFVIMKQ